MSLEGKFLAESVPTNGIYGLISSKGARKSESRTGGRLVSPAIQ